MLHLLAVGSRQIDALKSSLLEKDDPGVKKELKALQERRDKDKAKECENPDLAEKAKNDADNAFNNADYPRAIEFDTEAIKPSPGNPTREAYQQALEIDPNNAEARFGLENIEAQINIWSAFSCGMFTPLLTFLSYSSLFLLNWSCSLRFSSSRRRASSLSRNADELTRKLWPLLSLVLALALGSFLRTGGESCWSGTCSFKLPSP
jgi:tetratricopeptide (TPR) repeat protein